MRRADHEAVVRVERRALVMIVPPQRGDVTLQLIAEEMQERDFTEVERDDAPDDCQRDQDQTQDEGLAPVSPPQDTPGRRRKSLGRLGRGGWASVPMPHRAKSSGQIVETTI